MKEIDLEGFSAPRIIDQTPELATAPGPQKASKLWYWNAGLTPPIS